jgi:4-amino-4-deoxy-L-arabinose transferase-like glycosyltransferase
MVGGVRKQLKHLALALGLLVMSALMLRGYTEDSPTEDELTHLVRGIAFWRASDTRLSYAHPPLGNAWSALPVAWDKGNPDIDSLRGFSTATASTVTRSYVNKGYAYAREQLMRARLASMALGLLLVAYLYYFCLEVFGLRTALAALVLLVFNPVLVAQCRYVTTDPAAAIGFAVAVGELVRYLRGARFGLVRLTLGVSLGLLTKFSGVTLVPLVLLAIATSAAAGLGRFGQQSAKRRALGLARDGLALLAGVLLCINLAYKGNDTGMTVGQMLDRPEPSYWVNKVYPELLEKFTPLPRLPRALPIPLPYSYLFGFAGARGHASHGFTSYFWGERLTMAPPWYLPVMLVIKTPTGMLALLGAAAWLLLRRRKASLSAWVLGAAVVTFLVIASRSNLAMGVRHGLPVIPPLAILAARAFALLWGLLLASPRWRAALSAALGSVAVSGVTAGPDYLGYFNLIAGGRKVGHELSIYGEDWGQDRVRLANLVKSKKLTPLYYDPQTSLRAQEMRFLDVRFRHLRCNMPVKNGWVALHALTYRTRDIAACFPYLVGQAPDYHVNHHIYVWKVTEPRTAKPESGTPEAGPEAEPVATPEDD